VIQILAWVGLLESVQRLNWVALQALDRAGTVFRYSLAAFAVNLLAFGIGLRWGIVGVAACYAMSSTLLLPIYTHLTARILGLSAWTFLRDLVGVMQAAAAMAVLMLAARALLLEIGAPIGLRLAVVVAAGTAVFLAGLAWRSPEVLAEIRSIVRRPAPTERSDGQGSGDESLPDVRR
jgi:O-antigen/teichoic acid export membrane protein